MTKENSQCNFEKCGFNYTLALINGKYKMSIYTAYFAIKSCVIMNSNVF